ncbi:hypothetical protein THTE_0512 [Thermogutta terrifontis]|uniref:Uncharacterized protein n=1 Tax=Thermogutta terrifontis TaxID=1331910 RepID=A0A286RAX1_9BACT|nr:hypothetical protein THTE_0512 [Thermogutta terrifontis]
MNSASTRARLDVRIPLGWGKVGTCQHRCRPVPLIRDKSGKMIRRDLTRVVRSRFLSPQKKNG